MMTYGKLKKKGLLIEGFFRMNYIKHQKEEFDGISHSN